MAIFFGKVLVVGAAAAALIGQAQPGHAETLKRLETQIQQLQDSYQSQIQNLQRQVEQLKEQQRKEARQNAIVRHQAIAAAARVTHGPHVVETKGHEFGLESADGENSIYLTGRVHFDVGAYFNYDRKNTNAPLRLSDGDNVRRARLGVVGQFMGDWDYGLIYDMGGSTDAIPSEGIENAYVVYNGFYKHHERFPVAIDFGAIDVPWTMDEATSSNDFLFMEHPSSQWIATEFGGGDARTAIGVRSNNDRYLVLAYLTGPQVGASHVFGGSSTGCTIGSPIVPASDDDCDGPQMAFLARGTYQIVQNAEGSVHLGIDFGDEFRPRNGANMSAISLSDRPELRIDPTSFLGTGTIASSGGMVIGGEAAAAWQNAYIQGEYYHYSIDQLASGFPTLDFNGGYVEAAYSIGGRRHYKAGAGAYSGISPDHPLSWSGSGWGALELAARYSVIDLDGGNSGVACPAATAVAVLRVCGGDQQVYGIGLNYIPNDNIRFMFDLEHADISVPFGSATAKAASFDAIAMRTQIDF
ncbi:MAG: porin [Stellaceae bacterium]